MSNTFDKETISKLQDIRRANNAILGIDKLTSAAIGMWEYLTYIDVKTHSEWALASTYRALRPLFGSASPRLQVNLSIPPEGPLMTRSGISAA